MGKAAGPLINTRSAEVSSGRGFRGLDRSQIPATPDMLITKGLAITGVRALVDNAFFASVSFLFRVSLVGLSNAVDQVKKSFSGSQDVSNGSR